MSLDENRRQVILSTDGKHTVIATADTEVDAQAAYQWAVATYDAIVARYGTKAQPVEKASNGNGHVATPAQMPAPICAIHGQPMARRVGPRGAFWSCPQREADGSFCKYRAVGVPA